MVDSERELWDTIAYEYANLISNQGTPHHREILNPCVEELLGDVKGKKLLDAGCGEGYLSRYYSKKGAIVTGVDISSRLIEIGKEISEQEKVDVHLQSGNICNLENIRNSEFDIVLCNLVLLNVSCFDQALMEFNRILHNEGILVFSIVHPAFNYFGPGEWVMGEKNPETKRREGLYFKVDRYFQEVEYQHYWKTREGERFSRPIVFFHRTLSTYYDALRDAGFILLRFDEPLPVAESDFFDREKRVPFFAVFKVKKTAIR